MTTEVIIFAGISFAGGVLLWGRDVERRIAATEAVAEKLGDLINIMLEDRLGHGQNQNRSYPAQFSDSRSNR